MLQPKKTKFRRQQKGRMKGLAQRGNQLVFGSFGIKTLENCWLTGRQIEAEGVPMAIAKEALRLGAQKLPVTTKFVVRRDYVE